MKKSHKIAIIISIISVLVIATGVCAFIWYKGRDRRALNKAFIRLAEDMESRSSEMIPAEDLADMIDEIVYGDAHMDFSVNAAGLDLDGYLPIKLPIDLDNVTLGLDGELDRSCSSRELSASGAVSVMNYDLADLQAYVKGEDLYVKVPLLFNTVIPFDIGEDIFPGRESDIIPPVSGGIRGVLRDAEQARGMWDEAEIERNKIKEPITASDGSKLECTVYDVIIPADVAGSADGDGPADVAGSADAAAGDKLEYLIYVDEFSDIRKISAVTPIKAEGREYSPVIVLAGNEVPLDDIRVTEGNLKLQLTRDDEEYEVSAVNEDYSLEGRFEFKFDAESDSLRVIYNRLLLKIDDEEFLRSSGDVTITAGKADIEVLDMEDDLSGMIDLFGMDGDSSGMDDDTFGMDSGLLDLLLGMN